MLETVVTSVALVCYLYIIYVVFRHHRWLIRNKILMYPNAKINMYGTQKDMSFTKSEVHMDGKPVLHVDCYVDNKTQDN